MDSEKGYFGMFIEILMTLVRWVIFLFFVLLIIAFLPSLTSLAMCVAALIVCPIKPVRQSAPFAWVRSKLPPALSTPLASTLVTCALFFLGVLISPDAMSNQSGTRSAPLPDSKQGSLVVSGPIEYTNEAVNIFDYVSCPDEGVKLEALDDVNAREVGTHLVEFRLKKGWLSSSTETVELVVQDTQAPEIEMATKHIELNLGDKLDVTGLVTSAHDPVDGELSFVESEPKATGTEIGLERVYEHGWYTIEQPTIDEPGQYDITVTASDQHGNRTTETVDVDVIDPLANVTLEVKTSDLEYSSKGVETVKLVSCSDESVEISADPNPLDLSTLGDKLVTYTLKKDGSSKEVELTFHVRDTKKPTISLHKSEISIEQGESFDPYSNVESVRDEVDGDLTAVESEPEDTGSGWYTISGSYDVNKPSKYFFTVLACDNHGNRTTKEFSLTVNEPPAAAETQAAAPTHDYIINRNTGKFHYPSCYDVDKMNESNKWYVTMTRDEVLNMGYSPCGHCKP